MSKDELLKVLDMPEQEQRVWVSKRLIIEPEKDGRTSLVSDWSFADLAFRLRDEAIQKYRMNWMQACRKMYFARCPQIRNCSQFESESYVLRQTPIVWIVAALKAKEKAKQ